MKSSHRVVKNSLYGILGEGVGGVLQFVIIILIARLLGVDDFGVFSYVLAFVGAFQLIADFGLTNMVVREIVRDKSKTDTIIASLRPLILILASVVFLLIIISIHLFSSDTVVHQSTYVMAAAVLVTFQAMVYASVCRAYEEMGYNAIGFVSHKIVLLVAVLVALTNGYGIFGVAVAYFIANSYMFAFYYLVTHKRYLKKGWIIDIDYWKYLIVQAFPIGVSMVVRRLTLHVDTLILATISGTAAAGVFNSAYKVVQMIDMIPLTLAIPLYPLFTRLAKESKEKLFAGFANALRIFFLFSVPIFVWIMMSAPQIITTLFGEEYIEAVPALRLMSVAILFLFPTSLYIFLFAAMDKQKWHSYSAVICLMMNIVLDIILIPQWGFLGAAVATVIAEITFFVSGVIFLRATGCRINYLSLIYKPFLASLLCGSVYVWLFSDAGLIGFLFGTTLYFVVYFILSFVFKVIEKNDIFVLLESMKASRRKVRAQE